ncbi:MAG: hypothetical protein U0599_30225, partial [Vicinamibacteria bacterium]
ALLRFLPKHVVPPPPDAPAPLEPPAPPPRRGRPSPPLAAAPSLLVLAAAVAVAAAGLLWWNPPGRDAAFQATAARALLWRDAIPASLEPLLPLAPFGAHAPALATLAADVARPAGGEPAPAVALVLCAAAGLLLVGLYAALATRLPPWTAATAALLGLGCAPWPEFLRAFGPADALLALAFLLPAATLAAAHRSRASATAAGFLLAAGALAQPLLAAVAFAALAVRAAVDHASPRAALGRLALVTTVALAFGLPGLWPSLRAVSAGELRAVIASASASDAAWLVRGLLVLVAGVLAAAPLERRRPVVAAAAAVGAAAVFVVRVHVWMAAGQVPAADRAALERAAGGPRLEAVCAPDGLRDWVPAIAGRPAGEPGPWIPPAYRDEWSARSRRSCAPLVR